MKTVWAAFLCTRVEGYEICYRRVKRVNELVINGIIYDEIKEVIEFPHTLSAVDGHTIEAGLSEDSYSYITFDGECLVNKHRLIDIRQDATSPIRRNI